MDIEPILFCEKWTAEMWDQRPESEQEAYVNAELRRLKDEGKPILRAVLSCPDPWAQHMAIQLLQRGVTSAGEESVTLPMVFLRLVDPAALSFEHPDTGDVEEKAAVPPKRDPQGRLLPKDKQGHTLVVKVGNLGGHLDPGADPKAAQAFGGTNRLTQSKSGRPLYITREVTRRPQPFPFREAITILRQWGFGIGETIFRSLRSQDAKGLRERGQCQWLVEELSAEQAMTLPPAPKASAAKSTESK
jgi:hypothetical protein